MARRKKEEVPPEIPDGPRQKLFVPAIGDRLTLTAPWEFTLSLERRNLKFAAEQGLLTDAEKKERWNIFVGTDRAQRHLKVVKASLPAGTVLEVDRVYIRQFNKSALSDDVDFDSITFKVTRDGKPVKNQRFWTKLPDAYGIEFTMPVGSMYRDRVKVFREVHEA